MLRGVRILDFCWLIAGSLTTRIFADFGAEVIKVESMSRLDRIREGGPRRKDDDHMDAAGVFADCNSNKLCITLDLNSVEGIETAKELVAISDLVTNNFTGDRMDRWGLGYEDIVKINPSVIAMSMPVMGTTGPWKRFGAYGNGVGAGAGFNMAMGFPERPPVGIGPLYPDFTGPFLGATALFSAIHYRNRTGRGQFIDLAQYQASVSLLDTEILDYTVNGATPAQSANRSPHSCPHGAFRCQGEDRWVAIEATSDSQWQDLCRAMERPDLASSQELQTLAGRKSQEDLVEREMESWTSKRDRWEVMETLQSAGIAAGVVQNIQDALEHDQHMANEHFQPVKHPSGYEFMVHRLPIRVNGRATEASHHPSIGEHNARVYQEILGNVHADTSLR
jgi:benzylsuccinate CoA-transferase BbsF subunit